MSGPRDQCIIGAFLAWTEKEVEIQKKTCLINILICLRKFNRLSAFFSVDPPFSNLLFSVYSLHLSFYFSQKFASLHARYARRTFINDSPRKKEWNSLSQFRLQLSYLDSSYFFTRQSNSTLLIFYPRGVTPSHLLFIYFLSILFSLQSFSFRLPESTESAQRFLFIISYRLIFFCISRNKTLSCSLS